MPIHPAQSGTNTSSYLTIPDDFRFSGATLAACKTARDSYFSSHAGLKQNNVIISLEPTSGEPVLSKWSASGNAWVDISAVIKGDTGPDGQQGQTGATGPKGDKGDKGDTPSEMHLPGAVLATDIDPGLTVVDDTGATLQFTVDRSTVQGATILTIDTPCSGNIHLPTDVYYFDELLVAGGAGGGAGDADTAAGSGGGGAGGDVLFQGGVPNLRGQPMAFTVGEGGQGGIIDESGPNNGTKGGSTTVRGTTVDPGGAGGGNSNLPDGARDGVSGGGGPGASGQLGGTGSKYYSGGNGGGDAGGGGSSCSGKGESGSATLPGFGGRGVDGKASRISGINKTYGSSGGGAAGFVVGAGTTVGGTGGTGAGHGDNCPAAGVTPSGGTPGADGLGAGGGGSCGGNNGYNGGCGCIVLSFKTVSREYYKLQPFDGDPSARAGGIEVGEYYTGPGGTVRMRMK